MIKSAYTHKLEAQPKHLTLVHTYTKLTTQKDLCGLLAWHCSCCWQQWAGLM